MYILRWFNPFYERESTRPPYSICHLTPTTTLSLHSALPYLSQQCCGWHNTWTSENCLFVHSLCFEWSMWKHLELRSGVVIYEQLVIATLFPNLLYELIAWFNLIDLWASKCVLLFDCNSCSASVDSTAVCLDCNQLLIHIVQLVCPSYQLFWGGSTDIKRQPTVLYHMLRTPVGGGGYWTAIKKGICDWI